MNFQLFCEKGRVVEKVSMNLSNDIESQNLDRMLLLFSVECFVTISNLITSIALCKCSKSCESFLSNIIFVCIFR